MEQVTRQAGDMISTQLAFQRAHFSAHVSNTQLECCKQSKRILQFPNPWERSLLFRFLKYVLLTPTEAAITQEGKLG